MPFLHCISSFEGPCYKICKIKPLDLLYLAVFISIYIIRCHFSQILRTSSNIIWKNDFDRNFSFFHRFTQTHLNTPWMTKMREVWPKIFVDAPSYTMQWILAMTTYCTFSQLMYPFSQKNKQKNFKMNINTI